MQLISDKGTDEQKKQRKKGILLLGDHKAASAPDWKPPAGAYLLVAWSLISVVSLCRH